MGPDEREDDHPQDICVGRQHFFRLGLGLGEGGRGVGVHRAHILASLSGLGTMVFLMSTPLGVLGALFSWLSRSLVGIIGALLALTTEHLLTVTIMEISVLLLISAWLLCLQLRLRAVATVWAD